MAAGYRIHQVLGKVPTLEQPGADLGVIRIQRRALDALHPGMVQLRRSKVLVESRHGSVQCEHPDILQQSGKKQVFRGQLGHGIGSTADYPAAGRNGQRAAPEQFVIHTLIVRTGKGSQQGKTQRQTQRSVEAEQRDCLAQILSLAFVSVQGRVGDAEDLGRQSRVKADGVRQGRHADVGILTELNDSRGYAGRGGQVGTLFQPGQEYFIIMEERLITAICG